MRVREQKGEPSQWRERLKKEQKADAARRREKGRKEQEAKRASKHTHTHKWEATDEKQNNCDEGYSEGSF